MKKFVMVAVAVVGLGAIATQALAIPPIADAHIPPIADAIPPIADAIPPIAD